MTDTVSRSRDLHGNSQMTMIGYLMAAILLVVVLPLLPIIILLILVDKIAGRRNNTGDQEYASFE